MGAVRRVRARLSATPPVTASAAQVRAAIAPAAARTNTRQAPSHLLALQRTIGNRAVARMVGRARASALRRRRALALQKYEGEFSSVPEAPLPASDLGTLPARIAAASRGGRSLDPDVQRALEPAIGMDVSGVSIHTDAEADRLSRAVDAQAFTVGNSIFFRDGSYAPHSDQGMRLLAHELTHVGQQDAGSAVNGLQASRLQVSDPSDVFEQEADANADRVVRRLRGEPGAAPLAVRRVASGTAMLQRKLFPQVRNEFRATFTPSGAVTGTGLTDPVDLGYSKDDDSSTIHNESVEIPDNTSGDIRLTVDTSWGSSHVLPPPVPPRPGQSCDPCTLLNERFKLGPVPMQDIVSSQFKTLCAGRVGFAEKARFVRKVFDTLEKDPCALTDNKTGCTGLKLSIAAANVPIPTPLGNIPRPHVDTLEEQAKELAAGIGEMELRCEEQPLEALTGGGRTQFNAAFAFDSDGSIKLSGPPPVTNTRGAGAQVDASAVKETDGGGNALASLTVTIRYTNVRTIGDQQIPNATTFTQQFNVNLRKPAPPPDVPVHCGDQLKPFVVASDRLQREDFELEQLFDWFNCLPQVVQDEVRAGNLLVKVSGFASRTGGNVFNFNLAQKRADKAEKFIRGFAGTGAQIRKFVFGEEPAPDEGKKPKKEDPNQRRADVEIEGVIPGKKAGGLTTETACGVNGPFVPNGGEEPARQDCLDQDVTPEADDAPKQR